jgi:hypothetical protein
MAKKPRRRRAPRPAPPEPGLADTISSAFRKAMAPSVPEEEQGSGCLGCLVWVVVIIVLAVLFIAMFNGGYG